MKQKVSFGLGVYTGIALFFVLFALKEGKGVKGNKQSELNYEAIGGECSEVDELLVT
jgi:hypothetical protein